jgi:hypothetical protein
MQAHSSPATGSVSFPPDIDLRLFDHLLSGTPGWRTEPAVASARGWSLPMISLLRPPA